MSGVVERTGSRQLTDGDERKAIMADNAHHDGPPLPEVMLQLVTGYWVSQAVGVVARLGVPDHLAAGPRAADDLARAVGAHPQALYRVLRMLASIGVVPIPHTHLPYSIAIFAALAVVFAVVLHATPLGRAIFAIGASQEAAFFAGIRVKRIKFWLFVLSGALSGFAGVLWTLRFASARYDSGVGMELFVVTIVLLGGVSIFGGRGTIAGVVVAVAVLGCLQTALTADLIPAQDQNIVVGVLLVASVIIPNGGDLYRRARVRLRSVAARRHAAAAAQAEGT